MLLNILKISASNVLEMFLNILNFHSYKPVGNTVRFTEVAANMTGKKEQICTCIHANLHSSLHRAVKFKMFMISLGTDLWCVVGFPPYFALFASNTTLKFPPIIMSSHAKSRVYSQFVSEKI